MAEPRSSSETPQQRLAASRSALLEELRASSASRSPFFNRTAVPKDSHPDHAVPASQDGGWTAGIPWTRVAGRVARRWWQRHPANAVGQLAQPLLARYARQEPAKLIAASAATGALLVLVRPWRLLSATALLAVLVKTSDVADVVTSLMHNNRPTPRKDEP